MLINQANRKCYFSAVEHKNPSNQKQLFPIEHNLSVFTKNYIYMLSTFMIHKLFHAIVEFSWPANKWIKGNFKQVGFYRVHYDDDNWKALIKQLNNDHTVSTEFCMMCTVMN